MIKPSKITDSPGFPIAGISRVFRVDHMAPQEIWKEFMPLIKQLQGMRADDNLYAIQFFNTMPDQPDFTMGTSLEFWAAIRVHPGESQLPKDLKRGTVNRGTYAVFIHRGPAGTFPETLRAILEEWLPASGYMLSKNALFQVMPPEYPGPEQPDAEEEVWIPLVKRS